LPADSAGGLECLQCGVALTAPSGGGPTPKFCSSAHRAKYNRDQARRRAQPIEGGAVPAVLGRFDELLTALQETAPQIRQLLVDYDPVRVAAELQRLQSELNTATSDLDAAHKKIEDLTRELGLARELIAALRELSGTDVPEA
jgi:hypothetical protein